MARLALRTQEGRDALRSPQAHYAPRPSPTTRSLWRTRRVPPRGRRSEPPQARQTDPDAQLGYGLRPSPFARSDSTPASVSSNTAFFNSIGQMQPRRYAPIPGIGECRRSTGSRHCYVIKPWPRDRLNSRAALPHAGRRSNQRRRFLPFSQIRSVCRIRSGRPGSGRSFASRPPGPRRC